MMSRKTKRFAYEHAEAFLDAFAAQQDDEFIRGYLKLKGMTALYAYVDYHLPHRPREEAMARGWEELQIAFTGRGEAFLSGAVLQMWNCCDEDKGERAFERAVKKAFKLAEEATPAAARRLYTKGDRQAPIRHPDEGFTLSPLLPSMGVRLREWAVGAGFDPDEAEANLSWIEASSRLGDLVDEPDEEPEEDEPFYLLPSGLTDDN
jgi:hypothetical protein